MNEVDILNEDILLPYQKEWIADESSVKVWEKSRRIGASYVEALDSVLNAAKSREAGGQSTYYLSYNKEMTQQFVRDCAFWARHMNLAAQELQETVLKDEDKDITVYRIRFASGYEIWGMPSEPRSLRSKQGRVVIDEAAFVDNLPELLKAAMALRMWGGSVRIMSTHNGEDSDFNEMIKETRAGKRPYTLHRVTFDDALEQGLYYRIALTKGWARTPEAEAKWRSDIIAEYPDGADEELFCVPTRSGAKYFPRALVERAMDPDTPVLSYEQNDEFTYLEDRTRQVETDEWIADNLAPVLTSARLEAAESGRRPRGYIGMDFARSGDLSVLAIFLETERLGLISPAYVELRNVPFAQQFQVFCYAADKLPGFSCAAIDARGNGQMIAELAAQRYGPAYVHQVMIARQFYLEYMPKYKAKFEDEEIRIPKHDGILDDHRTVVMDKGIPMISERSRDSSGKMRHGDAVVAGVMAVYAQVNDDNTYQPYQYEPVTAPNPWRQGDNDDW
jgi:phage FluMu gp28-like protein